MPVPLRLLYIVDGDGPTRNILRLLMTYLGWDVRAFSCAEECIRATLLEMPECILADLSLPAMSAVTILLAARANGHQMPIVALTNQFDPSLAKSARAAGIREVLYKPCGARKLEAAVRRSAIQTTCTETRAARR